MSEKEEALEFEGVVVEAVKGAFRVKLDSGDMFIHARVSGKIRKNNIRVVNGDRVRVEISPYDLTRGRITYRLK